MRKGIAITTILLLLVGTLVSGVTIYYTYRTVTGSPLTEFECRGMMISWCGACANLRYEAGPAMDPQLSECASKHWGITNTACNAQAEHDCPAFLPGGGGGVGNGGNGNGGNGIDSICVYNPGSKGCYLHAACPNPFFGTGDCTCYDGTNCDDVDPDVCCCICPT